MKLAKCTIFFLSHQFNSILISFYQFNHNIGNINLFWETFFFMQIHTLPFVTLTVKFVRLILHEFQCCWQMLFHCFWMYCPFFLFFCLCCYCRKIIEFFFRFTFQNFSLLSICQIKTWTIFSFWQVYKNTPVSG